MGILSELDKVAGDILKDTRDILIFIGRLLLISTFIEDGFRMWHQWTGKLRKKGWRYIFCRTHGIHREHVGLADGNSYSRCGDQSRRASFRSDLGALPNFSHSFSCATHAHRHYPGLLSLPIFVFYFFQDDCLFDHFRHQIPDAPSRHDRRSPPPPRRAQRPSRSTTEAKDARWPSSPRRTQSVQWASILWKNFSRAVVLHASAFLGLVSGG